MSADDTLDLRPFVKKHFKITGATGREYQIDDWLPVALANDIEKLFGRLKDISREEIAADPGVYDRSLDDGLDIALMIMRRSYADLTIEELREDMPHEAVFSVLTFLFAGWVKRQRERFAMVPQTLSASVKALTPKPTPISSGRRRAAPKRVSTGST
jgi:hypothetical protein